MTVHSTYLKRVFAERSELHARLKEIRGCRVLVTGATGVVGFAIARVLQEVGATLVLHALRPHALVSREIWEGASWHYGALDAMPAIGHPDLVFHCATYAQPQKFTAEWMQTIDLNVQALMHILPTTRRFGFASTTEIYSGLVDAATEDMVGTTTPQHPRATYIESKRLGEAICAQMGNAVSNRIALAAGPYPRLDDSRAMYQIVRRAKKAGYVQLEGGGANIRQYQYSFACALRFIVTTAFGAQAVYNNAGPYLVSMNKLGETIANVLDVPMRDAAVSTGMAGAPAIVKIDTTRIPVEFPCLADIDPGFDEFVRAVVESVSDE